MKPVLLDSGCIVALLDRSERFHRRCVDAIRDLDGPLVTCEAVIAESCYLLRRLPGAAEAVLANVAQGHFRIPIHLERAARAVRLLLAKYADVPMDLADACLVHLAEHSTPAGSSLSIATFASTAGADAGRSSS